jgi:hypothetical protein
VTDKKKWPDGHFNTDHSLASVLLPSSLSVTVPPWQLSLYCVSAGVNSDVTMCQFIHWRMNVL